MAKDLTILGEMRVKEHQKSLAQLSNRDLCEMIRAHFASHPTLPGEKELKDRVNNVFESMAVAQRMGSIPDPKEDLVWTKDERQDVIDRYARIRIRETPLKEGNYYLDFRHFDPAALKREKITEVADTAGNPVLVERVNVELQKNGAGEVYALAEQSDGSLRTIGTLPDNFLKNNPMNVESCCAELQISDYSNGNMKNLSARIVVDTDLMSGDVIDLNDEMLAGLENDSVLEQ